MQSASHKARMGITLTVIYDIFNHIKLLHVSDGLCLRFIYVGIIVVIGNVIVTLVKVRTHCIFDVD